MSITDVQTTTDFDDPDAPVGLRTPLYLVIAGFGALMLVATFLTWAGVAAADGSGDATSVNGLDAGGWGLSAMIAGAAIVALGVLGYFWNPFSDPEAMFLAVFGAVTSIAAVVKIVDAASLIVGASDFNDPQAGPRIGLWLVLLAGVATLFGALWILYSRPRAHARLLGP